MDAASYEGKVVGGIVSWAAARDVDVLVVAGDVFDGMEERAPTVSLVATFGAARAHAEPLACVRDVVADRLRKATPQ